MRAFVTGATGFIGGALARHLRANDWDVTALVRTPSKASDLDVAVHLGDVTSRSGLADAMREHDVVFHLAAWYALGARDRARMEAINIGGTTNVLEAAREAGVPKVVYCSSVAALGPNPPGIVGDETKVHDGDFGSLYEETKHRAHMVAHRFASEGMNVSTVMPGAVYGPGDDSVMGTLITWYAKRMLLALPFAEAGISFAHVDDVAAGIASAREGGPGEDYILGGENVTIGELFARAAPVTGIKSPRVRLSTAMIKRTAFISPVLAKLMGEEPDMIGDAVANMRGSWMFSSAKASKDFGYSYRGAVEGLAETVASK